MALSSNSVIHFTKTKSSLKGILENNFKLKYCLESVTFKIRYSLACPMVSFCDIPLSQAKNHISNYEAYGIGLTKKWANDHLLNPVIYLSAHSSLASSIETVLQALGEDSGPYDEKMNALMNLMRYCKNYQGTLVRGNTTKKNYRFSDEREWRYVPDISKLFPSILSIGNYDTPSKKASQNRKLSNLRLEFTPSEITYIIVKTDKEISEFVDVLRKGKGGKYTLTDIERLMTRIITRDQIKGDF